MRSKFSELWRWDCGNVAEDDDDDDDDGDGDRDRDDCCCGSALWIYFVGVSVCVSVTVKRVCVCVCVRAPRQFNSSVTKTFCTAFDSCSFPRRHSRPQSPPSSPFSSLFTPSPFPSSSLPHSLATPQSTGNAYWHHWLRQQAATPQNWAAVAAADAFVCMFDLPFFSLRPFTPSRYHSLTQQSPSIFTVFPLFFRLHFLRKRKHNLPNLCVCFCVCLLNIVRYLVPASIAYFPCFSLFPSLSSSCSFCSVSATMAASVHFLTSMFIFNDLRFSGNLRKNMWRNLSVC